MTDKIIIRADGNAKIGAGHLMRCMTIAEAVVKLSGNYDIVQFFCADEDSGEMARSHGFDAVVLRSDYREMEAELPFWAKRFAAADGSAGSKVILVDSYYVTDRYLLSLRAYGQVYLMDDMQTRAYPVDGVINYNVFADRAKYEQMYRGMGTRLFLGKAYVPLRSQFQGAAYCPAERVENILITTGGGDADNIAGAILDAVYREGLVYHVLVGRFSPHFESWRRRASKEKNIRIHVDVKDMASLMKSCDLAVTAGGSTVYELAAVGVPFICFSYAENQEALAKYIDAGYAGAWHLDKEGTAEKIKELFQRFCTDGELRQKFSAAIKDLIDGRGAERLAETLLRG